jgi:hypothetical protein
MQATDRSAKALKYKAADGSVIGFKEVSSSPSACSAAVVQDSTAGAVAAWS